MILSQCHKPERDLGKIHGYRILIHPVKTTLRHEPARIDDLILVNGDRRSLAMSTPRFDQRVAELAAGLNQERSRAHCWITHFEVEDLRRCRRPPIGPA